MPGYSPFYDLAFFDFGDVLNTPPNIRHEINRFLLIDKQLYGLYRVIGDGAISGWTVSDNGFTETGGIAIQISSGRGIINSIACETGTPQSLDGLPANTEVFIYAVLTGSTAQNRSVSFVVSYSEILSGIKLASVITSNSGVESIDNENRDLIDVEQQITTELNSHKHRGTPSRIDLASEVKNELSGARIESLESSKINLGKLDNSILPSIIHDELKGIGVLTHAQLETLITSLTEDLGTSKKSFMDIGLTNQLRQILFLKTRKGSIDKYYENNLNYIPGISSSSLVDNELTTALVDTAANCIVGPRNRNSYAYFFTKNFAFDSKPTRVFIISNNNDVGEIKIGVNTNNSSDFDDYQIVPDGVLTTLTGNTSENLKIGVRLEKLVDLSPAINYDENYGYYSLYNNSILFNFVNTDPTDTFNFRISFYTDPTLTSLAFSVDSTTDANGFSIDNTSFSTGGETINNGDTVQIIYDPLDQSVSCDVVYYLHIEYHNGSSWNSYTNTEAFKKNCNPSFTDYVDFDYINNSGSNKYLHFRIRFYENEERTSLVDTVFSDTNSLGWVIDDQYTIPESGYLFNNLEEKSITFYPILSNFEQGRTYYLMIDAWDGSNFISEMSDFTFYVASGNSNCDQYATLPVLKNFSILFELEDGSRVKLNSSFNDNSGNTECECESANMTEILSVIVDGNGSPIVAGSKGFSLVPFSGTILGWYLVSDASSSVTFGIKTCDYFNYPSTASIVASSPPQLSASQKNKDTTLSGWSTSFDEYTYFEFEVTGSPTATYARLDLILQRS